MLSYRFRQQTDLNIPDASSFAQALSAVLQHVTIDRTHSVPYTLAFSNDGKTIYIDKRMPSGLHYNGRFYDCTKFLVLHAVVLRVLLVDYRLNYQQAHAIAIRFEKEAVETSQLNWLVYNRWCVHWAQWVEKSSGYETVPTTLSTKKDKPT